MDRRVYISMVLPLILSACNGADIPKKATNQQSITFLSVVQTFPEKNATDVPQDTVMSITLDEKADAYSAIPQNFQVWSEGGTHVGGAKLVSQSFVPHPQNPGKLVSQIRIGFDRQFLLPNTKYYVTWGQPPAAGSQNNTAGSSSEIDPAAIGIMGVNGAYLPTGYFNFQTGNRISQTMPGFQVVSSAPVKFFVKGNSKRFESTLGELVDIKPSESYVAQSAKTPIYIQFSQPIGYINGIDPLVNNESQLGEIPATRIDDFPYLTVLIFDVNTRYDRIYSSFINLNMQQWTQTRRTLSNRMKGTVRSRMGRRLLEYTLDETCAVPSDCEYPDSVLQVAVVLMRGMTSMTFHEPLEEDVMVGGFFHFSGASARMPFISEVGEQLSRGITP